jgi:hypothetical protein
MTLVLKFASYWPANYSLTAQADAILMEVTQ